MRKVILQFIFIFYVVTGLYEINVNAQEVNLDNYNYEALSPEIIAYSNSNGRSPVVGLDDGRTYTIGFALSPNQLLTVSNDTVPTPTGTFNLIKVNSLSGLQDQEWIFLRDDAWEDGVYTIVSAYDNKGISFTLDTNEAMLNEHGLNLYYLILINENGYYEIIRTRHNTFMGLQNGHSEDNTQVIFNPNLSTNERQWTINPYYKSESSLRVLLEIEEEVQLSVTNSLQDNLDLTWTSTDESVATVDSNGRVTAISEGTTYIWARNEEEYEDFIPVIVVEKGEAKDLRLAVHLNAGESTRLFMNEDYTSVAWSSLDTNTAIVDSTGRVTAISEDLTIITAEYNGTIEMIYIRVV